jgi:hypothetical protein
MEELRTLRDDVSQIKNKVGKLFTALLGDDITKNGGLVQRLNNAESNVEELSERINNIEKKNIKVSVYVGLLWAAAGGVAMAILALIIK